MLLAWQSAGVLLGAAGVASLYLAWQRKGTSSALTLGGLALVASSIFAWSRTSGIDKGPALGILSTVLVALLAVGVSALRTPVRTRRAARVQLRRDYGNTYATLGIRAKASTLLVIVVLGFFASLAACVALFMAGQSAGFEHTGNLAITMFAFPLAWAALSTWLGYAANPVRGSGVLAALLAAALAITGLAMWGG